jgi:hypothetical protein
MTISRLLTYIFTPFLVCIFHLGVEAQENVGVTADRDRILIGEQVELTLRADVRDELRPVRLPSLPDSMGHLEVVRRGPIDSLRAGDKFRYTQVITVTSFDSGRWVIPPLSFSMRGRSLRSDSVAIHVMSVPLKGTDYNDIREIIDVEKPGLNWRTILIALLGGLLILASAYYWYKRQGKRPVAAPLAKAGAYEEALDSLKKLQAEGMHRNGAMKAYYSRLYDIFRIYYSRISGASYMEATTDELMLAIREKMPVEGFSKMAEVLRITDAVKFARYTSSAIEAEESWQRIRNGVDELNQRVRK